MTPHEIDRRLEQARRAVDDLNWKSIKNATVASVIAGIILKMLGLI